jgi:peptide/nickel transport system substrate-binding protein
LTKTLAALALIASIVTSAGCSRVENGGSATHNPWTIPGTLRIAQRETPDNLNMLLGTEVVDTDISMFWAGYLFKLDDRNQLVPDLALTVPTQANGGISPDGLRITYHLRRGVVWQDGAPFTADDVVFTWHALLNPKNTVVSRFGYDIVSSIDEPDRYTLVVHLKHRFSPFVATFFAMANHADCILPKHILGTYASIDHAPYNLRPIGTGPFRIVSYDPGSRIVFEANDRYWGGPPKLKRVIFQIVGSDNTLLTLAQSHQIDLFYRAPETLAENLRSIPGMRVVLTPLNRFTDIGFNAGSPALADVRVRRALAYGTDRKALIDKVTHGIAMEAQTDQPSFQWAFNPHALQYPYDPERAKRLLASAGVRTPLPLQLVSFTGSATITEAEELLQSQWGKLGIDVSIKNYPSGQLYATVSAGGIEQSEKFDAVIENWANGSDPDESILVRCNMAPPNGWNIYRFCDPAVDAAEKTAVESYDPATRARAYAIIQQRLNEELPFFVIWYEREFDVVNTDLQNYKPAHAVTPFWNTAQWSI